MPQTAQVVISIDSLGNLICEGPGLNGQRQKIEGFTFDDLPEAIQDELTYQRLRLACEPKPILAPSVKDRIDPEVERQRQNEEAARQRRITYEKWFNNLTKQEQEIETAARQLREERNANRQKETAHSVWYTMAQRPGQGTAFANRIMSDSSRRPRVARKFDPQAKSSTKRIASLPKLGIFLKI